MADSEIEEVKNLKIELEWFLRYEVHSILKELRSILVECANRFPVPLYDNVVNKTEKFMLIGAQDQLKCSVTLTGDSIMHADISFKVKKSHQMQRTSIMADSPWKLHQIQEAANHLQHAISYIDNVGQPYCFKTSEEVFMVSGDLLNTLQRGRTTLIVPKKKPIDELMNGCNMKSLKPNLPNDQAISFFLQSHKLMIAVYQLTKGSVQYDCCQAEFSVPWLNDVLLLFTVGLQLCQQLKHKISHFRADKCR